MALSANTIRSYSLGQKNQLPVKASAVVYVGSAVGSSGGYARALVAGDKFMGFALEKKTGGSADGDITIEVQSEGVIQVAVSSAAVTDIGKRVYASDDGTFTFTQGSNSPIGTVRRWVSTGQVEVDFASSSDTISSITALTDSTGGSANNTLAAITLPTALTDNGGGTADGTVASAAAPTTLTDSTGDSGTHDDTLADGLTVGAITAYSAHASGAVAVTSNAATDLDTTAAALATLVTEVTTMRANLATQNQNDSDLAQKVIEIVTWMGTMQNNLKEVTTELATTRTALSVTRDCLADLAAKVNEIIAAE